MKTLKNDWLTWIILLLPLVFIAMYWDKFPDQIPTHFNIKGEPDDYSGKAFGLFLMPAINVMMYFLFLAMPIIDPSRKNYGLFQDKFKAIRMILHVFFTLIFFIVSTYALGYKFNMTMLIFYSVLTLFLLLGNYMGNVRHNYFIGVRTPWTLANEEVWTKTHRLTAKLWVFSTLIMMCILPFVPEPEVAFITYVIMISVIPIIYSYIIFRKIEKGE